MPSSVAATLMSAAVSQLVEANVNVWVPASYRRSALDSASRVSVGFSVTVTVLPTAGACASASV